MNDRLVIANSLRLGKSALDGARSLAPSGNHYAAYLCEQGAELIIRAVLTSEKQHGNVRHDLEAMVDLIPDANPLKTALRELEPLASYATTYRYTTTAGRIPAQPTSQRLEAYIIDLCTQN
jgi:HEPN domain-containing protein